MNRITDEGARPAVSISWRTTERYYDGIGSVFIDHNRPWETAINAIARLRRAIEQYESIAPIWWAEIITVEDARVNGLVKNRIHFRYGLKPFVPASVAGL